MNALSENYDFQRYRDEGSTESLARVFDALAPRLLLLAAHLTPDPAQAEDLVQTTFLHGMRDAQRYDGKRSVSAWLAGILNHRALDMRRRNAIRSHEALGDDLVTGLDPAKLAADQELFDCVVREIDAIAAPYREVLSLRIVHGLSPTAIAHTLGRTPGAVRMQLKRGLERLREAMPERSAYLGVFLLESGRGLDVIKEAVLAKAGGATAASASTVSASHGLLGGLSIMKLALIASLALFFSAIPWLAPDSETTREVSMPESALETGTELAQAAAPALATPEHGQSEARLPAQSEREVVRAEEAPADDESTFVVRVYYQNEQEPAADVGVYVRAADEKSLGFDARTNSGGIAAFTELTNARHVLHVDRLLEPIAFDAVPGGHLLVQVPSGVQVSGRVVDLESNPVAGARILRLNENHHDVLQVAAIADDSGRFAFRDVAEGSEFLARSRGFQPSELKTVRSSGELEFVMGARGHRLRGEVLDADGKPAPFAWIAIGVDEDARDEMRGSNAQPLLQERRKAMDLEAILLRADEKGRFESDEVPAGFVLTIARPVDSDSDQAGYEKLWIPYGDEGEVTVRLRRSAVVEGVLKSENGEPIAGLRLEAEWEGTSALGQLEDALGPLMSDRCCISAEDGSFRLAGLLAGDYDFRVVDGNERLLRKERIIGEGELVQWNPIIKPQALLNVRIVNENNEPLVGWVVNVKGQPGLGPVLSQFAPGADAQGRYQIRGLAPQKVYELTAHAREESGNTMTIPAAQRSGIIASKEEVVLRLTADELTSCRLAGCWLDASGKPQVNLLLDLTRSSDAESATVLTDENGKFLFDKVPAGSYRLSPFGSKQTLATVKSAGGEDKLDLTVRSPGAGN